MTDVPGEGGPVDPSGYRFDYDENGVYLGPARPATSGSSPSAVPAGPARSVKRRRPRRAVVLIVVAAALVAVLAAGAFFALSLLRGGARSPEVVGERAVAAINERSLIKAYGLVNPSEREAARRLAAAVSEQITRLGVGDVLARSADRDAGSGGTEFSLDGVQLSISGASPEVEQLSEDVALLRFKTGEARLSVDPAATRGLLRTWLDAMKVTKPLTKSSPLAELGPDGQGICLVAIQAGGRWYLSPLLSGLEAGSASSAAGTDQPIARGNVPAQLPEGSDSGVEAASLAVAAAVNAVNDRTASELAPRLAKTEALALYLYGDSANTAVDAAVDTSVSLDGAEFTEGERDGDRQAIQVKRLSLRAESESVVVTPSCVESGAEKHCVGKSGYSYPGGVPLPNPAQFFARDGAFGLTAVEEEGSWKISVMDTVVDGVVNWLGTLTREQAIALVRATKGEEPAGGLVVDKASEVVFNAAGYAVRRFTVTDAGLYTVNVDGKSAHSFTIYSWEGGEERATTWERTAEAAQLAPGDYKVVVWADPAFDERLTADGNAATMSASVAVARHVLPSTFSDDYGEYETVEGTLSYYTSEATYRVRVPDGASRKLLAQIDQADGTGTRLTVYAGDEKTSFVPSTGKKKTVRVPDDAEYFDVRVVFDGGTSPYFATVRYSLQFG